VNPETRDIVLDCLSNLWTLSKRSDDYWRQVASLEWEESLSYFSSLTQNPGQLENLFGALNFDEKDRIFHILDSITQKNRSQTPGFLEISLWAALIEAKSAPIRKEWFLVSSEIDKLSRQLVGAPSELEIQNLHRYLELSRRYMTLSKHLHPAFDFSRDISPSPQKREIA